MKRYVLALLMVTWVCSAAAETWEWVDSQGTVSFTDDLQNIPKQYRKTAKKIGGDSTAPQRPVAPPVTAPVGPEARGGGEAAAPAAPPTAGAKQQESYGGRPAAQWKEAFASLNSEIRGVDSQLKEKQKLLKEPGTLSRSDYLKLEDEIRRLSSSLTALLARWELLSKEANTANVPGSLRQ